MIKSSGATRAGEQFVLRMPDGMRERVKVRAAENRRSMNSELVLLVEKAMKLTEASHDARQ